MSHESWQMLSVEKLKMVDVMVDDWSFDDNAISYKLITTRILDDWCYIVTSLIHLFMLFETNSTFYMVLLTYMHENI